MGATRKVSMNLPEEMLSELASVAKAQGTTMTDVVRQAVSVQRYLAQQVRAGGRILVQQKDKSLKEIILLK
jgi:hypothetical protein